jgi:hypothetical protein
MNGNGAQWKQQAGKAEARRHTHTASSWMDRRYLPANFTRMQQHRRKRKTAFNPVARNRDKKILRKQNKTNTEREKETWKMSAAPRN